MPFTLENKYCWKHWCWCWCCWNILLSLSLIRCGGRMLACWIHASLACIVLFGPSDQGQFYLCQTSLYMRWCAAKIQFCLHEACFHYNQHLHCILPSGMHWSGNLFRLSKSLLQNDIKLHLQTAISLLEVGCSIIFIPNHFGLQCSDWAWLLLL